MKFGVVGVIAFIIDYGLLALLTEAFGVNYLVSATISVHGVRWCSTTSRRCATCSPTKKACPSSRVHHLRGAVGHRPGHQQRVHVGGRRGFSVHYLITKIFATAVVMVWNFVTRKIFLDAGDGAQGQQA